MRLFRIIYGQVNSAENILFNNCYLHYITELTANISTILGHDAAAAKYLKDAETLALAVTLAYAITPLLQSRSPLQSR